MKTGKHLREIILVTALVLVLFIPPINTAPIDDVRASLNQAFSMVVKAEGSGGDVSDLVAKLNQAAGLLNVGDSDSLARATVLINEVMTRVGSVEAVGAREATSQLIMVGLTLVVLSTSALLIYFYGSRVFWLLWLRTKRNWRVEAA